MSGTLVSPGVQVQLINQSFYASGGQATVPFIMMATAENKTAPGSTAIASGTIKTNANSLYLITSQRDLVQTFGNPTFYTQAGTPQNGNELNEYGLYAAYQYLGVSNSAYVMRADIDLAALKPTSIQPTGAPKNGDYWLDLADTTWGLFTSKGTQNPANNWASVSPIVITNPNQLELFVQGYVTGKQTTQYTDNSSHTHTVVYSKILSPNLPLDNYIIDSYVVGSTTNYVQHSGTLGSLTVTNGSNLVTVTISGTNTLAQVANSLNAAFEASTVPMVNTLSAEVFSRVEVVTVAGVNTSATTYNLRIKSTDISFGEIELQVSAVDVNVNILDLFGFVSTTPQMQVVPRSTVGEAGNIAVNTIQYIPWQGSSLVKGVQMYQKITNVTQDGTTDWWYIIGSDEANTCPGFSWKAAKPNVVTSPVINPTNIPFVHNTRSIVIAGKFADTSSVAIDYQPSSSIATLSDLVADMNHTFAGNANIVASILTSGTNSYLQITNYDGTDLTLIDATAPATNPSVQPVFYACGIPTQQTFFGSVTSTNYSNYSNYTWSTNDSIIITIGGIKSNSISCGVSATTLATSINSDPNIGSLVNATVNSLTGQLTIAAVNGGPFTIGYSQNFVEPATASGFPGSPTVYFGFLEIIGIPVGVTYGASLVYQQYTNSVPQPSALNQLAPGNIWMNTIAGNRGASWVVKRYNAGIETWQTVRSPLFPSDNYANSGYGGALTKGSVYVQYDCDNTGNYSPTADLQVKVFSGTGWVPLDSWTSSGGNMYTQSLLSPAGLPASGTMWFNPTLQADILVGNGEHWQGYLVAYPNTDPNGPQISSVAPSFQSDGVSPLVDFDLWIDSSDLENYPIINRWDTASLSWIRIDNTDHASGSGIIFADVRADDGTSNTDIQALLKSSYIDPDAPAANTYSYGMLVFNTRWSTNNVKSWNPTYLSSYPSSSYSGSPGRWVTISGNAEDGTPYMGRKAQRHMVVEAMKASLSANQGVRSETNLFNLMAAPGYIEVLNDLLTINTDKKNPAFVVADTPARLAPTGTAIQAWATNTANAVSDSEQGLVTHSYYSAAYYPWGLATNLDGNNIVVPPSTQVLITYALNDQVAYPWFPPAGFNRGMVTAFESVGYLTSTNQYIPVQLNQGQRDTLYVNEINPIAYIPGRGLVVYGQKTLSPVASALDRVNVARLVCYLNYQLDLLAKPFLFELNDQFTRASVTRTFEAFLGDLIGLRAIYDYAVVCDSTNNTPSVIDANELYIDVAIQPEKSIEFIYIPLRILNTNGSPSAV
jgi:Phage tail sheath C-terminal domain